eukprot:g6878.t1
MFYLNKHGGRIPVLDRLTREFLEWSLVERNIRIHVYHCPGTDIIELGVDGFSRGINPRFRLRPEILAWIQTRYRGAPLAVLPLFNKILSVIDRVLQQRVKVAVIVTPIWPQAPWWPQIVSMMSSWPLLVPRNQNNLTVADEEKERSRRFVMRQGLLVWKISGSQRIARHGQDLISKRNLKEHEVQKLIESTCYPGHDGSNSAKNTSQRVQEILSGIYQSISMRSSWKRFGEDTAE